MNYNIILMGNEEYDLFDLEDLDDTRVTGPISPNDNEDEDNEPDRERDIIEPYIIGSNQSKK